MVASVPKDKQHTVFHLRESMGELRHIIEELESNSDYSPGAFQVDIEHAYHHLNYAWNSRRLHTKRAWASKHKDFFQLRQMPKDLDLGEP